MIKHSFEVVVKYRSFNFQNFDFQKIYISTNFLFLNNFFLNMENIVDDNFEENDLSTHSRGNPSTIWNVRCKHEEIDVIRSGIRKIRRNK